MKGSQPQIDRLFTISVREVVRRGPPPGLVAFNRDIAVGWLDRTWRLERVDDLPVWLLS